MQRSTLSSEQPQRTVAAPPRLSPKSSTSSLGRTTAGDKAISGMPSIVAEVLQSPGQPLDPTTRRFMETRMGGDFTQVPARPRSSSAVLGESGGLHEEQANRTADRALRGTPARSPSTPFDFQRVRLHVDEKAAQSAHALQARAYTIGSAIVFGRGEYAPREPAGRWLLAHELTHVIQQNRSAAGGALIQRVGLFESIARAFGGGTFSSEELTIYLAALAATGRIQDKNDSDNKARAVVQRGLYASQPLSIRVLLIREMLTGYTGDDDEKGILTILQHASPSDLERIVEQIGSDRLVDKFSGDNLDRLYLVLARSARGRTQPVATDWFLAYEARGAVDQRGRGQGLVVDALRVKPDGSPDVLNVVSKSVPNADPTGAPVRIASQVKHPRDVGGAAFMALHVPSGPASVFTTASAGYPPITRDKHRVLATVALTYERVVAGTVSDTAGKQSSHGIQDTASTANRQTVSVTDGTSAGASVTATRGTTDMRATQQGQERSEDRSTTNTTTTSVSLTGTLTSEAKATLHLTTGMSVGGGLLGSLLALTGPEGAAIGLALKASGALDAIKLTLGLAGDGSFTLTGQLSGTAARTWSEAKTHAVHAGTNALQRQEHGQQAGEAATHSAGETHERAVQSTDEHGSATTQSSNEQRTASHTDTTNRTEAVMKHVDLGMRVE